MPGEENEVVRNFHAQAKAWKGEPLRPADMKRKKNWMFAVSTGSGGFTSTNPLRKNPLPNYSERAHLFCNERTNQPQPQGLRPSSHCMAHQTM